MDQPPDAGDLPHPTSSLVEMFEMIYAHGRVTISAEDAEDQAFKSAFAVAQVEKAGYTCVGLLVAAAASLQFPRRLIAFGTAAPVVVLLASYLPRPMHKSMQTSLPFMARKYEPQVIAYYQHVFEGPALSWKARSEEEKQTDHKERSLKVMKSAVTKREIR